MWIDFEREHNVLAGLFFGRHAWLFGADGAGVTTQGDIATHGRSRRYVAYLLDD